MVILNKFRHILDNYDPYGIMRVNAFQCLAMLIGIFLVNSIYNIPHFNIVIQLPLYACIAFPFTTGYNKRLKSMAIYDIASIVYAIILNFVYNYHLLTVFTVGMVIASFFYFSKKRSPELLTMVGVIHPMVYSALVIPNGGNLHQLTLLTISLIFVSLLSYFFFSLFPRIYFFRIWLRGLYFTIEEIADRFNQFNLNNITSEQLVFKHLIRIQDLTDALSYKEHGLAARRISLCIISTYTIMVALVNRVILIEHDQITEIYNVYHNFSQALKSKQPLTNISFTPNNNQAFAQLKHEIENMINVWNKLCLKI